MASIFQSSVLTPNPFDTEVIDGSGSTFDTMLIDDRRATGLLGEFGTNAAAAYALVDLGNKRGTVTETEGSYSNPVVRVRRDSDSTFRSFTASEVANGTMLAWVGTGAGNNGIVPTLYDQSGSGNDATQSTVASMPTIVSAGALVDSVYWPDGDYSLGSANTGIQPKNGTSVFAVIRAPKAADSAASGGVFWSLTDGSQITSNRLLLFRGAGSNTLDVYLTDLAGANTRRVGRTGVFLTHDDALFIVTVIVTASDIKMYINGQEQTFDLTSGTLNNDITCGYFSIGSYGTASAAGELDDGNVAVMVPYSSDKSTDRQAIESKLANFYGITLT